MAIWRIGRRDGRVLLETLDAREGSRRGRRDHYPDRTKRSTERAGYTAAILVGTRKEL